MAFAFLNAGVVGPRPGHRLSVARLCRDREDERALGEAHQVHQRGDVSATQRLYALAVDLDDRAGPGDAGQRTYVDRELAVAHALTNGWQYKRGGGRDRPRTGRWNATVGVGSATDRWNATVGVGGATGQRKATVGVGGATGRWWDRRFGAHDGGCNGHFLSIPEAA